MTTRHATSASDGAQRVAALAEEIPTARDLNGAHGKQQDNSTAPKEKDDKGFYHLYVVRQKGASLLRLASYTNEQHGQRPAAWGSRSTADYWGRKITEGERYLVLRCLFKGDCPVCRKHRKGEPTK